MRKTRDCAAEWSTTTSKISVRLKRGRHHSFEIARVIVRRDQIASYFQPAGQFLKRRESEKVCHFRNLLSPFPYREVGSENPVLQ